MVIGGAALQSHGQRYETEDIDVTPDASAENLERLADVLNRLECSLEVDPAHPENAVSLPPDYFTASVLAQATVWNLRTAHGKLDLTLAPSGFPQGYTQLIADAEQRRVAATTITVAVASLADVEHSKRIADRAKDRAYLQQVGRLGPPHPTARHPREPTVDCTRPAASIRTPRGATRRESRDRRSTDHATRPRTRPCLRPRPQGDSTRRSRRSSKTTAVRSSRTQRAELEHPDLG